MVNNKESAEGSKPSERQTFNPSPRAGNEFLLVNMYAEYNKDLKGNDAPFFYQRFSFDISDGTYAVTETGITAMFVPNELAATMYEGGKTRRLDLLSNQAGRQPGISFTTTMYGSTLHQLRCNVQNIPIILELKVLIPLRHLLGCMPGDLPCLFA